MFENKVILITGGTGSWGYELTRQLLKMRPKEIRIFSRGEFAQVNMQRKFESEFLRFIIGDVRDEKALEEALQGVDYVFHLAALKHVHVCEMQPHEAVKTNIMGTANLIRASIKNNVKKVIDVSTDKAVAPLNLYGMTKGVAEKMIVQANHLQGDTQFVCIRAGNVLGSNGSVVPLFIDQIKKYNKIMLTHKEMTRYFLTIPEAITLLFEAAERSIGGEIFVMKMPACRIIDLAEVIIKLYGNSETQIEEIGMRAGEKLHEELISVYELGNVYEYDNNYYLIIPNVVNETIRRYYNDFKEMIKMQITEASLKDSLMSEEEIRWMLQKGSFILSEE